MQKVVEIVSIKQVVRESDFGAQINSPEAMYKAISEVIGDEDREMFFVVCLNVKNEVIAIHRASVGTLSSAIVMPREVFKSAILNNASSIIVSHNHPSGNTTPSQEDIDMTKRLAHAGEIIGIPVLDHVIVTHTNFLSLKERGLM